MPALIFTLLWAWMMSTASGAEVSLRFEAPDREPVERTLAALQAALPEHRLDLFDPMYGKDKHYRALALADVLRAGFGDLLAADDYSDVVFTALDGYTAITELNRAMEPGGFLVFADVDVPGWEPVGAKQANPGPLYVVWSGSRQLTAQGYPWPWQLAAIRLVRFRDQYPEVYPGVVGRDTAAYRGFLTFKTRCLRCHSLNRQGGKVGPDLNAPQNVLSYRSVEMVKEFIRNPSRYRYTNMPDHQDLSDSQLNELIEFLWLKGHQAPERLGEPTSAPN